MNTAESIASKFSSPRSLNKKLSKNENQNFRKPFDFIEISDDSKSDFDFSSSEDDEFGYIARQKYPKDVVIPYKFDMNGKISMKRFSKDYENYFTVRYGGTQRECSQEVSRFLSGDAMDAYEALGGSNSKYNKLKPKLLRWLEAQRVRQTERNWRKFPKIVLN